MGILTSARIKNIARACSGEYQPYTGVAINVRNIPTMRTTVAEESKCMVLGSEIGALSSHIWSRCQVGIIQSYQSIASKITKAIGLETCVSQQRSNRLKTDAGCDTFNKKSPTYDLSFAGPKNRFTIFSNQGPLIVHNCGYGAS